MRVTELPTDKYIEYFRDCYFSTEYGSEHERSPGWHGKAIIDDLLEHLGQGRKRDEFTDHLPSFSALGFIWERIIGQALNDVEVERRPELIRPGEQELDGIFLTPDAFNIRDWWLEEWKCKWASCRYEASDLESKHPDWVYQTKAYCKVLGVTEAVMRAYYVNGIYQGYPMIRFFHLEYSQRELDENWGAILRHRESMQRRGLRGTEGVEGIEIEGVN